MPREIILPEDKALRVVQEIRNLCDRHGIWRDIRFIEQPDLAWIIVEELKIKIHRPKK